MHPQYTIPSIEIITLKNKDFISLRASSFDALLNSFQVYIWEHTFTKSELLELAHIHAPQLPLDSYIQLKSKRLIERLSVDLLLHQLLGYTKPLAHEKNGRPYLPESNLELSVSHSGNTYALSLSAYHHGFDIELWDTKALRVASKFLSSKEQTLLTHSLSNSPAKAATLLWSAKEAAYKYFNINGLQLLKDMDLSFLATNKLQVLLPFHNMYAQVIYIESSQYALTLCYSMPNNKKYVTLHH